jgi:predicted nucleic acid-binding Zn ribbon protein
MAILIDETTRVVVQGLTGKEGSFHSLRNREYGTNVVAGVTPGKSGQNVEGIPIYDTVASAVDATEANASLIFVPARFAADAIYEAADAGVAQGMRSLLASSPAIQFKGSGFYITDYPKGDKGSAPKSDGGKSDKAAKADKPAASTESSAKTEKSGASSDTSSSAASSSSSSTPSSTSASTPAASPSKDS